MRTRRLGATQAERKARQTGSTRTQHRPPAKIPPTPHTSAHALPIVHHRPGRGLVLMHDIRPAEQSDTEMVVDAAALSRIRMR